MKSIVFGLVLLSSVSSFAAEVEVECVNGAPGGYQQTIPKKISMALDYTSKSPMAGLDGYTGKYTVEMSDKTSLELPVRTECHWNDINFNSYSDMYYNLATFSDLIRTPGVLRNATFNITNKEGWKKSFAMICVRTK